MTALLTRPAPRVPAPAPASRHPLALVAAFGGVVVAAAGLLLVEAVTAAAWFAGDTGTFGQAMSIGALCWLLSNGSGLGGGGLEVQAVPLGFALLAGYALYRAGRWSAAAAQVRSFRDAALGAGAMAAAYAAIGLLTARLVSFDGVQAPLWRTAVALLAGAAICGGAGLIREARLAPRLVAGWPEELRAALFGGLGGWLTMLAFSAVAFAAALIAHLSTAFRLADGLDSGLVGGVVLALVGAGLVPNAVLCTGSFLAGPGFALGTGTSVSPGGVRLGLLPDFPLLAALPTSANASWLPGLVLLPVVAGGVAAALAVRRYPVFGVDSAALRGALAGLAGGVGFGLCTVAATGALGPGRLHQAGPEVLATTAVCAIAFLLGGVVTAVGARWLSGALDGVRRPARAVARLVRHRRHHGEASAADAATTVEATESQAPEAAVAQPLGLPDPADEEATRPIPVVPPHDRN